MGLCRFFSGGFWWETKTALKEATEGTLKRAYITLENKTYLKNETKSKGEIRLQQLPDYHQKLQGALV